MKSRSARSATPTATTASAASTADTDTGIGTKPGAGAATFIALLRGINVGKAKRVAMADLRRVVEALGYSNVRTLLNSGNVVFDGTDSTREAHGPRIEAVIGSELGVACRVTVLTAAELAEAVARNPLDAVTTDPSRLLVVVLANGADRVHVEAVAAQDWSPEAIAVGPRVAYLWCADGVIASRVSPALGRRIKDGMTARNWTTMLKLNAMANEPSAS